MVNYLLFVLSSSIIAVSVKEEKLLCDLGRATSFLVAQCMNKYGRLKIF